ncbi:MAG: ACT domain-containing protein [Planctomycetota bacterium]
MKDKHMNSAHFCVNITDQPGSLQRLLGTIRRRGFSVDSLIVTRDPVVDGYRVEARLAGDRSFETLARHVANLFDVASVSLQAAQAPVEFSRFASA